MSGLEYGNTRLRARRAQLLDASTYALLLGADTMDRLLGLLSDTPYRPDIEAAVARHAGARRLDAALRSHLARALRDVLSFYTDPRVPEVLVLLERWDVRNLQVILRAKAHPQPALDVESMTVPAGRLGEAELAELIAQDGVRAVVDLIVAWGLPSPTLGRRLVSARAGYEASGDALVLEDALHRVYAARLEELPEAEGADDASHLLRAEIDASNIVAALRLFAARQRGEDIGDVRDARILPGGRVRDGALLAVVAAATAQDAVAVLQVEPVMVGWLPSLAQWGEDADLVALEQALAAAISQRAAVLAQRTDPLGPGIPVAYVFAKEAEVRNLRWIGAGIVHQLSRDEVAAQLQVPT